MNFTVKFNRIATFVLRITWSEDFRSVIPLPPCNFTRNSQNKLIMEPKTEAENILASLTKILHDKSQPSSYCKGNICMYYLKTGMTKEQKTYIWCALKRNISICMEGYTAKPNSNLQNTRHRHVRQMTNENRSCHYQNPRVVSSSQIPKLDTLLYFNPKRYSLPTTQLIMLLK